jgi:hypothetical protein
VDGPGNIIIRNTCSGNTTSWDIVAGNVTFPRFTYQSLSES